MHLFIFLSCFGVNYRVLVLLYVDWRKQICVLSKLAELPFSLNHRRGKLLKWKETRIGGTPIFHWTMIAGGRKFAGHRNSKYFRLFRLARVRALWRSVATREFSDVWVLYELEFWCVSCRSLRRMLMALSTDSKSWKNTLTVFCWLKNGDESYAKKI